MKNKEYPVSEPTLVALNLLKEREEIKVRNLEEFISVGHLSKELAQALTEAQKQLISEPQQIYLLIGDIICEGNESLIVDSTSMLVQAMSKLNMIEIIDFTRYELLFRRDTDNKLAVLVFRLLQQAKGTKQDV